MASDVIRCERCAHETFSWGAEACLWWPTGCQGTEWRVCPECMTDDEGRELAEAGCTAAAWHWGLE